MFGGSWSRKRVYVQGASNCSTVTESFCRTVVAYGVHVRCTVFAGSTQSQATPAVQRGPAVSGVGPSMKAQACCSFSRSGPTPDASPYGAW